MKIVQLGFVEEQEQWLLKNRFFPSKVGGLPAWLELENIPESQDLSCDYCGEPCIFLCQIYAGSEKIAHAFHRTIFVFICKNGKCCSINQSGNIKVFRSQLALENKFYPSKPPDESMECDGLEPLVKVCRVCGCRGPLVCGKCKKVSYCGQSHQKIDWKVHKSSCGTSKTEILPSSILFPEFEIIIEQEEQNKDSKVETEQEAEKRRLREYNDMVKSGAVGVLSDMADADLQDFAESKEDKTFGKFKKAIEEYGEQVLRYSRSSSPLWISDHGILNQSNVPNCGNCNGRRTFEFQIMPQLLNELKNYELDWGIIAIYTCEKDCDVKGRYVAEFAYNQSVTTGDDADDVEVDKLSSLTFGGETNKTDNGASQIAGQSTDGADLEGLKMSKKESKRTSRKPETKVEKKTKAFEENDAWE